jgi:hypothetical protein
MAGKHRGVFSERLTSVQCSIPIPMAKAIKKRAEKECISASTCYRNYILKGFKADQKKGVFE